MSNATYDMAELQKESRMGAIGSETTTREIRRIDISDFENRKAEIADQLWDAAVDVGFFQIANHGIDLSEIRAAFEMAERFFALPDEVKGQYPLKANAGWESRAQVRPSTGTADQKESYQITRTRMEGLYPTEEELPGFKKAMHDFELKSWEVGMKVLSCFALKLGFDEDFFRRAHDMDSSTYQSTLRLLHYYAIPPEMQDKLSLWRAGAHTDFDCLTLLYQRQGQGGLQVLPGKEAENQAWTPIPPEEDLITCNIGDMLMRWSDDKLPSNFHRVKNPLPGEYMGPRYSLAFFCQANTDALIESPTGKYAPITAGDYLKQRIAANFKKGY
ncbi:2OG-Fe(II) oxygenase family protein [Variovorax dokdonensis]|uniref:2-oxoglutarate-dependent ethylene/succinate-forming enzyme n=1 Tax=Variovorax dokdonensis TaxID=344883 RepID=A0ABT7NDM5_9BURK|nr:2OG-Fe(II) oxygenase family protein [Variovorax dokdonensis]MDM0046052.1 2OG-Fe(II) oxygenase family protein [Variovorax dokdonensis]